MSEQIIVCPSCSENIELTDALTSKIRDQLKGQMEKDVLEKQNQLKIREQQLEESLKNADENLRKRLEGEKLKLWERAKEEAAKKMELEVKDLKIANQEKEKQLEEMRKQELDLRQKARELETKEKNLEIEFNRKMDEATKKLYEQAKEEANESSKMKLAEKDKQLEQLKKALDEANKKAEQGSMQVQGDAQESQLKMALASSFPQDLIEDVPTGIKGADLVQTVVSGFGQKMGIILWESKNTKAWGADWIKKLKDDQSDIKADIVIIASQVLPDGVDNFGLVDGVWVTAYKYAIPLANALRLQLMEINKIRLANVGKDQKLEMLYTYLSGAEFRNRIETIVMAFDSLKQGLDAEKRSMEKIWSRREKEIERVIKNTVGFYGDVEGIMGKSLPTISALELGNEQTDLLLGEVD